MKNFLKLSFIFLIISLFSNDLISNDSELRIQELTNHIKYLASDELEGRKPGTEGADKAADYIAAEFQKLGLKPVNGKYKQSFKVRTGYKVGPASSLDFDVIVPRPGLPRENWQRRKQTLQTNIDWTPLSFSDNNTVTGEMAFVGYGISAPDMNYDDYAGIDVTGKIVIIIMNYPGTKGGENKFVPYSSLRYKATNAKNKGAAGIIFVKEQGDSMNVFLPLNAGLDASNSGIVAIQMNRLSLGKFFPKGKNLKGSEESINKTHKPESFIIPDKIANISVNLEEEFTETSNVMALFEGTDSKLKAEYIIVGAHYDHLGWGASNSRYMGSKPQIHNGADDNASGTAAVIEIAENIVKNPTKRSVLFMAFSAEEMGLLGSKYYTENFLLPLDKSSAMINLDMVGRLRDNEITVFGSASSPDFEAIFNNVDNPDSLQLKLVASGIGPSDHTSFYQNGVPAIHIFTGIHDDYHMPTDDWDRINYEGTLKVVNYTSSIIKNIDNQDKLTFREVKQEGEKSGSKHGYGGPWFGIVPSFEESPLGCQIGGTSPGSPAQAAGLEKDDIITKINDTEIKNLHDFMYKVREHKAGDVLKVHILRDKKEIIKEVKLTVRK